MNHCSRTCRITAVFAAVCLLLAMPAAARTLESVGAVGVREGDRSDPKERAVDAAVQEAVWRVAEELLVDAMIVEDPGETAPGGEPEPLEEEREPLDLAAILGEDMVAYTTRFKVIEDRGLGPVLFVEDPEVVSEYVVVAEVVVETDRIRERLTVAGLIEPEEVTSGLFEVDLEIEGVLVYPALTAVRALLLEQVGAESATPRLLERGRAVLGVTSGLPGPALVAALERAAPLHLTLVALEMGEGSARLAVSWNPPDLDVPANGAPGTAEASGLPDWAAP